MTVQHEPRMNKETSVPAQRAAQSVSAAQAAASPLLTRVLAVLRIAVGLVFLWAFLDKTFGLGYATTSQNAWVNGGSPTNGFLSRVAAGPLESTFHSWAGAGWADWLFMLGLLGIGVAVTVGIGLRIAAVAGTAMLALMWLADWPLARTLSSGEPSMSSNPILDSHLIYAVVLIALAVAYAGNTWGLGRRWAQASVVRRYPWLQ